MGSLFTAKDPLIVTLQPRPEVRKKNCELSPFELQAHIIGTKDGKYCLNFVTNGQFTKPEEPEELPQVVSEIMQRVQNFNRPSKQGVYIAPQADAHPHTKAFEQFVANINAKSAS